MGIQGLLSFLKPASEEIHIKQYAGKTVAVDTYCWLHRGAFACADKLAKGEPTDQYVRYCMKYLDMMVVNNVHPILVFDGCHLPSKKEVETQRRERRKQYMEIGKKHLREGNVSQARDAFTKCVSVTHHMALDVIKAARLRGIDCIVAPYEADSQLAYLLKSGYASAVVTEDSDLLCFGCEKVIFKLDLAGHGVQISMENLGSIKNLIGFTPDMLRHMCILSGCDYLPSIKGVGLVKSCNAIKLAKSKNIYDVVRKLHQYIKGISEVEPSYSVGFEKAEKTFKYQLVMDPKLRKLVPLNSYQSDVEEEDLSYAGPLINDVKALDIAVGNINVNNGKKIGSFDVDIWLNEYTNDKSGSIWHGDNSNYKPSGKTKYLKQTSVKTNTSQMFKSNKNTTAATVGLEKTMNLGKLFARAKKKPKAKQFTKEEVLQKIRFGDEKEKVNQIVNNNSESNVVVKSRFFHKSKPKTEDDTEHTSANHHNLISPNREKDHNDPQLNNILDELNKETSSKVNGWISTGKNAKKRKRSLNSSLQTAYEDYCKENEIRTPLKSPRKLVPHNSTKHTSSPPTFTPKKRKLTAILLENHSVAVRRSPRKPHRKVIKPPDDALKVCETFVEESVPLLDQEENDHNVLNISTESIPLIDRKTTMVEDRKAVLETLIQPCEVSLENCMVPENPVQPEVVISLSSDDENQDITITDKHQNNNTKVKHKICNRKVDDSNKRNTSKASKKTSKYFTGTKASGLRKKPSKNQPTIFSLFKKQNNKDQSSTQLKKSFSELTTTQNYDVIEI